MERCPTCRAKYRGGDSCYRCQTDLRQVLALERAAVDHRQQAVAALQDHCFHAAHDHAQRACELHRTSDSVKLLALTALAGRKFDQALIFWQEYSRNRQDQSG